MRIKEIRIDRGISQSTLAGVLEISTPNYSKKENGQLRFSLSEAKRLADYLKLSVEEIFFEDDVSIFEP